MTRLTGTARIVIIAVLLAVVGVVAAMTLVSRSTSSAMSGMDHGSGDASMSMPAPTSTGDMPGMDMSGMDHGSGDATPATPAPTSSGDMPGMDHGSGDMPGMDSGHGDAHGASHGDTHAGEASPVRPLAPVLGTFGGGTGAVLLTAGLLRRKDRLRNQAKAAARAARRSAK